MKRLVEVLLGLPAIGLLVLGALLLFAGLLSPGPFTSGFAVIGFLMLVAGAALLAMALAVSRGSFPAPVALGIIGLTAAAAVIGFQVLIPTAPDLCPEGVTGAGTDGWSITGSMATKRSGPVAALLLMDGSWSQEEWAGRSAAIRTALSCMTLAPGPGRRRAIRR